MVGARGGGGPVLLPLCKWCKASPDLTGLSLGTTFIIEDKLHKGIAEA